MKGKSGRHKVAIDELRSENKDLEEQSKFSVYHCRYTGYKLVSTQSITVDIQAMS